MNSSQDGASESPLGMVDISGTAEIGDEGIKKFFQNTDPWRSLAELIWNGFDAHACYASIDIVENDVGGVAEVVIYDDGDGIDPLTIAATFGRFNESAKNRDPECHGAHGRGRLAFFLLCGAATWLSNHANGQVKIDIRHDQIKKYSAVRVAGDDAMVRAPPNKGTLVSLLGFHKNLPPVELLSEYMSDEFGWYLAVHQNKYIEINCQPVRVPTHVAYSRDVVGVDAKFTVTAIHWAEKPRSEKSMIYLIDSEGRVVQKILSRFNRKAPFYISILVQSQWLDEFTVKENDLLDTSLRNLQAEQWRSAQKKINDFVQEIYEEFLRDKSIEEVEKYVAQGNFPTYPGLDAEYAKFRLEHAKSLIVAIYRADPSLLHNLHERHRKVLIRLLDRLLVSQENDALLDVLSGVLDMQDSSAKMLAHQLNQTSLDQIVSTIEVIRRRQQCVDKLREVMNKHYREVLETPDLQRIIEANTWLFGPEFETIGAEEDSFTALARSLRDTVPGIDEVTVDDVEDPDEIDGAKQQVDLFLARKFPHPDSTGRMIYRCVIVEIKRPSVALNYKHLQQLDGYARVIRKHAAFNSLQLHFDLILVGRTISTADVDITGRVEQMASKGRMGLYSDEPRMRRFVLSWGTILDGYQLSNNVFLERLKLKREDISSQSREQLVADLQVPSI